MIAVVILEPDLMGLPGVRAFLSRAGATGITVLEGLGPDPGTGHADVALCSPSVYALSVLQQAAGRTGQPPALLLLAAGGDQARFPRLPPGPVGVLPREATGREITAAVRALSEGLSVGPPDLLAPLLARQGAEDPSSDGEEHLTLREVEVLHGLASGRANKQIAGDLGISEHTVKFYTSSIYGKLGVTNRAEAVAMGVRLGILHL